MNVIETTHLTKKYGDRAAVLDVHLTVARGEIYGFLGPNGAGKTTTLRMILGLVRPSSGAIDVLDGHPGDADVAYRIGALIEGPGFFPYLSGRNNLRYIARMRGLAESAAEEALTRVALTDRADERYKNYSLGMKQRLGVACALLGSPELIVLDEPTNGLDPSGMADMRTLIVSLASEGHTVLLSSHLLAEVQDICDRVGVIDGGRLLQESTVEGLRGDAQVVIRATPLDQTQRIANNFSGSGSVIREDDHLVLPGSVTVSDLVAELVGAGIQIHEVIRRERSLEDVFFELTTPRQTEENHDDHHALTA
ncbi:ABC transporter ATP-binding protein [Cumulibacter soli]|uniref:ABC transporter ATP-binding protein n=1 Tax=Cumulibacter soli TaxID=2546344 RepID=UPI00106749FD|nr:ABC transporter ATP-binding protein [Cumulibacter soli]